MKTFADIFKKSFLNDATMDVNLYKIFMSLLAAFICGMIIYFVYKYFYKGVLYSHSFNILLVLVSMITAFIVLTISSNIVLSLGMVGALSIVRFRTAVKDPLDVGFYIFCNFHWHNMRSRAVSYVVHMHNRHIPHIHIDGQGQDGSGRFTF